METAALDSQDELIALRALVAEQAAKLESQEAEVIKRDSIIELLRAQLELRSRDDVARRNGHSISLFSARARAVSASPTS